MGQDRRYFRLDKRSKIILSANSNKYQQTDTHEIKMGVCFCIEDKKSTANKSGAERGDHCTIPNYRAVKGLFKDQ